MRVNNKSFFTSDRNKKFPGRDLEDDGIQQLYP